jgi:hypothetical protein
MTAVLLVNGPDIASRIDAYTGIACASSSKNATARGAPRYRAPPQDGDESDDACGPGLDAVDLAAYQERNKNKQVLCPLMESQRLDQDADHTERSAKGFPHIG